MKSISLSVVLVSVLAAVARGQPAGRKHGHLHKKAPDAATGNRVTITDSRVTATTEAAEVLIYVNKDGKALRTATEVVVLVPPTPASTPVGPPQPPSPSGPASPNPPPGGGEPVRVVGSAGTGDPAASQPAANPNPDPALPVAPTHTPTAPPPPPPPPPADPPNSGHPSAAGKTDITGVTYSPYHGDGTCKSASEVLADFGKLSGLFNVVRLYGVDCNQVATAIPAAKSIGATLFLGLFNVDQRLDNDIATMVSAVQASGGWGIVSAVSVGNEMVNNGQASAAQIVSAVVSTRQSLRSAGYAGPVVTVDTFNAVQSNPQLCDASDFCAMNVHPFFNPNTPPSAAGEFVLTQVSNTRPLLANKNQRIVVTESGWPTQGTANGQAVPSKSNQQIAIASIRSTYGDGNPGNLILFTAFNDMWKKAEAGTFYAEQYWGMLS